MISKETIEKALRNVKDPELGHDIINLGLVYDIIVTNNDIKVIYTLTSPACPAGAEIEKNMRDQIRLIPNVSEVTTELTFTPAWTLEKVSADLRAEFGLLGMF